jgi:hypothetical protein
VHKKREREREREGEREDELATAKFKHFLVLTTNEPIRTSFDMLGDRRAQNPAGKSIRLSGAI